MRRPWCVAVLALSSIIESRDALAEAEHYEQIRVDGGMTGSFVSVSDRNGAGMVAEIKVMVHDHLAIGGRVEVAVMFGGHVGQDELPLDVAMAACGLVKGEYYLGDSSIRPFVGLGVGGYTIGSQTISSGPNTAGIDQQTGRYFGIAPQIGIDLGRLRLAATYNAILGATLEVRQTTGNVEQTSKLSQSYLSLELSFRFAGGRKQPAGG
ncbi:MAG TPA: hypothetical protein VN253_19255 [Kofleriaceae bacterium]|nr:hypothetical protein [Kofleriaceae bacterium]